MKIIKLMADYQCYPLWESSPGNVGNISPDDLPISRKLRDRLIEWASMYDATLNTTDPAKSGFRNKREEDLFKKAGLELADRLREELGPDYTVIYNKGVKA